MWFLHSASWTRTLPRSPAQIDAQTQILSDLSFQNGPEKLRLYIPTGQERMRKATRGASLEDLRLTKHSGRFS